MRRLLKKLTKYLVYLGAGMVILLAVAVGLFRLFLPRLPEYQDEIKNWASAAIGVQVEFSEMDARWRLRGPELSFHDAELVSRDDLATLLRAQEVSIGVGLLRLLVDRELAADRILIREATVDVSVDEAGRWHVQGVAVDEFPGFAMQAAGDTGPLSIVGEDIDIEFRRPDLEEPVLVTVERSQFRREDQQQELEASIALPVSLGDRLQLAASKRLTGPELPWQFFIDGEGLDGAGWSRLAPAGWPVLASGAVDLSLWVDVADGSLRSATANFAAGNVVARPGAGTAPFAAEGRVEFTRSAQGWLLAADNLQVQTPGGQWPETMLQLRAMHAADAAERTLSGSATYLRLEDFRHVLEWLPAAQRELVEALAPVGVVRNADFTVTGGAEPLAGEFNLSADMDRVGVAAYDGWPGIRGFSGTLRADQSGGRLEIDAAGAELDLARWLETPVALDVARGTVIWRRNERGTTLLSDSVALQNADVTTDSSFQATLPADGGAPVVDVRSRWSVRDVGSVIAYLPPELIKPTLYKWLDDALVSGRVSEGTARLAGPLDRFPFDEDEGIFEVEAQVENAVLLYSMQWPAVEKLDGRVFVDKTRLYSVENSGVSAGNRTVDAQVEIEDLRQPVLRIAAHAAGTLETIRRFSMASPIANVFGGHLERVHAEGPASFDFQLTYPILDRGNYDFSTAIRADGGALDIDGLAAPITDLTGVVNVTRDDISSDSLQGSFLGDPVILDLERPVEEGPYSVIVTGHGTVGDRGLADGLGTPFADVLGGTTSYVATVRFPRAGAAEPRPLEVAIDSDLEGMAIDLPEPAGKEAEATKRMAFVIGFPEEGRIESRGDLTDDIRWNLRFAKRQAGWDFDRGTVALGGAEPGGGDTRGLHIEGELPALNVDEWLALGERDGGRGNFGERVRSVDVVADELTVIGQRLARHHLTIDRSALDWAVTIDGENAVGDITLPYDFAGERPLLLDMEKLLLPAGDDDGVERPQDDRRRDPRTLPAITVRASEFALGERRFGNLRLDIERTGAGLAGTVETTSESFYITGRAGWLADETDETGQRSFIEAQLVSSNVERTMRELDYLSGVESESLLAEADLSWSGGFGDDFLATLDGLVRVEFGTGQLDDLEPGAGRVFGLMSVVALPRRLALDFRDVFDRGFGFDAITGTFRLVDGEAYTCDLSLKGPAADVGIVGRTGLVDEQYQQAAVVSTNVGNTLPVVGAVVAGPQVAAALLIFSQIFKKPLQEMGQIYYTVEGPWDDPVIDSGDAPAFAEAGALAGCLDAAD